MKIIRRQNYGDERPAENQTRDRIRIAILGFLTIYMIIAGRLVLLGLAADEALAGAHRPGNEIMAARPDLTDRNGEVLATDIKTASLYAEPRRIVDPDEAAELITSVFPELDAVALRKGLSGSSGFMWLKREIDRGQQEAIRGLGIPGVGFLTENRRFYPGGPTASHIVGHVNVDNQGIAGMEKYVDDRWLAELRETGFATNGQEPVRLSIDLRVQHIVRDELERAMERYHAVAATGIVLDIHTGEVIASSSLPDYDPNKPADALQPDRLNRMTAGVFELGSVFKTFTVAMALDTGTGTMASTYDASRPIRAGGFSIGDFHGKHRVLTLPEVFIYSSNIGAARMAIAAGSGGQEAFLGKLGMLKRIKTELPETAPPVPPHKWGELATMTIAFGHGISETPMHVAVSAAALMNGGKLIPPTFLPRDRATADSLAEQVVSERTSQLMRYLFRLNVEKGSGRRAEVPGYLVGGKTGTAEKVVNGRYSSSKRLNSFLAAFPMDKPQYVVLMVVDEPEPEAPGQGATAGSNAAPMVANVIRRSAQILGVRPRPADVGSALLVSY